MQSEVVFYPNCERNIANELNFYSIKVNGWYVKFLKVDALEEFHPSSMPIKTFATLIQPFHCYKTRQTLSTGTQSLCVLMRAITRKYRLCFSV
jgi:hypothetical protein